MAPKKYVALIAILWLKTNSYLPVCSTENNSQLADGRIQDTTATPSESSNLCYMASSDGPVSVENSSLVYNDNSTTNGTASSKDPSWLDKASVDTLSSFMMTFLYCHIKFICGLEKYTYARLITNSLLAFIIHPAILFCSRMVNVLINFGPN